MALSIMRIMYILRILWEARSPEIMLYNARTRAQDYEATSIAPELEADQHGF